MKRYIAQIGIFFTFIISQFIACLVADSFHKEGYAIENPENPANIFIIISSILIFTFIILLISKYREKLVKYIFFFFFFIASISIFDAFFHFISSHYSFIFAIIFSMLMIFLITRYPKWYIINIFGIFLASGIIAIFSSLPIAYIIILLSALAIYDFISVYKTKHMIKLAKNAISSNLPLLLVFPKRLGRKHRRKDSMYMGLGDVVIPGILITASYINGGFQGFIFTLSGAIFGLAILLFMASRSPQPGLPFLNSGAIVGYAIFYFL
ncbi:MAG: presenilin family intramembrane aspartyl protease PSH [Candidatus Thermoplasmatota archaeon]